MPFQTRYAKTKLESTIMLTIGLTGGIGSGKSSASSMFESLGICVVDADIVAREVVKPGTPALKKIAKHFGKSILLDNSSLNRSRLREEIFSKPDEKKWLESLLHPIIRDETVKQLQAANSAYAILASPLLFETDQHQLCDRILLIDVSETIQLERASKRDDVDTQQIQKIISSQLSRKCKLEKTDDIILNHLGFTELNIAVVKQHELYLELAREQNVKG